MPVRGEMVLKAFRVSEFLLQKFYMVFDTLLTEV